ALWADRSPEMVAGMLGILKAGAAYLPLDPAYPAERLQLMVEDADPQLLVSATEHQPDLGRAMPRLVVDLAGDAAAGVSRPVPRPDPESAACVSYPSGSSGGPTAVVVAPGGLGALAAAQVLRLSIGPA